MIVQFIDQTRICIWGDHTKPPVVCFHGLGSTCLSFIELGEKLKEKYQIISIELPGHGKSSASLNSMDDVVTNIHHVIQQLSLTSFPILAHSFGAMVAMHYTSKYPEAVQCLFLIDGGYHDKQLRDAIVKQDPIYKTLYHQFMNMDEEITYYEMDFGQYKCRSLEEHLQLEQHNYSRWSDLIQTAAIDLVSEQDGYYYWHASKKTAKKAIQIMYESPITASLVPTDIPMTLLIAKHPKELLPIYEQQLALFRNQFPQVTCKQTNESHLIHWDDPLLVAEELTSFLDGLKRQSLF